ncbi:MAG: CAP domain-containing protein, partial [Desulfobulbus sp.]|nr:CAP domain-containing protein [Desulfobulbus sp.]
MTHHEHQAHNRRGLAPWLLATILAICLAVPVGLSAAQATVSPYVRTLLAQINLYRQDNGLTPLVLDPALTRAARTHSFAMFRQKRLSHLRFNERFQQTNSRLCVENIGRGATNPRKQFDNWRRSGAHDQNLLVE